MKRDWKEFLSRLWAVYAIGLLPVTMGALATLPYAERGEELPQWSYWLMLYTIPALVVFAGIGAYLFYRLALWLISPLVKPDTSKEKGQ